MSRKLDAAISDALDKRIPFPHAKHYCTNGDSMLELDQEMYNRGWNLEVQRNFRRKGKVEAYYYIYNLDNLIKCWVGEEAENEKLARAKAAYKALTGKEWQE